MKKTCCSAHIEGIMGRSTVFEIAGWLLPSGLLLLIPKCPMCIAAFAMIWTGCGLSFVTATYLRWTLITLCIACLVYLILTRASLIFALTNGYFRKDNRP